VHLKYPRFFGTDDKQALPSLVSKKLNSRVEVVLFINRYVKAAEIAFHQIRVFGPIRILEWTG
jgi:hypothetical protein